MNDQLDNVITICKFCGWYQKPNVPQEILDMMGIDQPDGFCRRVNTTMKPTNYCKKGHRKPCTKKDK